MRLSRTRSTALAIAASLALASCNASDEGSASPSPDENPLAPVVTPSESPSPEPSPSPSPEVNPADAPEVLQFQATTLAGESFSGADSIYGTPTVLWFWAAWCGVCRAEAPSIADALDELPEGVQLLGVPGRGDEPDMRDFVSNYGLEGITHLADPDGALWANFGVVSQPSVALIDAEGNVRVILGAIGKAELLQEAQAIA